MWKYDQKMGQKWVQNDPFLTPYGYFNLTFFWVFPKFSGDVLEKGSQKGSILTLSRPLGGIDFSHMMVKIDPPGGSMTPGGVILGSLFGTKKWHFFWQNCGFMTTKIGKRGSKNGSKMTQKWPKMTPFLTPFLTSFLVLFLVIFGNFRLLSLLKKSGVKLKGVPKNDTFLIIFDHFWISLKSGFLQKPMKIPTDFEKNGQKRGQKWVPKRVIFGTLYRSLTVKYFLSKNMISLMEQ